MVDINLHEYIVEFGRHKGKRLVHVPVNYLLWAANQNFENGFAVIAEAELKRRGTRVPDVQVSGHAIDRASLTCRKLWYIDNDRRKEKMGLHSWLCLRASQALKKGKLTGTENDDEIYRHRQMQFVFEVGRLGRSLKTVMNKTKKNGVDYGGHYS